MTSSAAHHYRRRIHFSETDAAGVAHFSRLTALIEEAEHDWFRAVGLEPFAPEYGWPRVDLHIRYHAPCTFGDTVEVALGPATLGRTTLTYHFEAWRGEPPENPGSEPKPERLFSGEMTICHVHRSPDGGFTPVPIPAAVSRAFAVSIPAQDQPASLP